MVSRNEFRKATERAEARRKTSPIAVDARYDRKRGRVVVELSTGVEFSFVPGDTQDLEKADASDLSVIEVTGAGLGIHFPKLDADLYVPALLEGLFGSRNWMAAQLGKKGGEVKSKAKAAASRKNGKLGGRPRKIEPRRMRAIA